MQDSFSERYSRQILLRGFGSDAQNKLSQAKVLVIGAGGLGVPVLQYLAGAGVGTIGIVDDDIVSLSNLHRQVLYNTDEVGNPKAEMAAARIRALNPGIDVHTFPYRLQPANALKVMSEFDIIVDATDNFAARYLINDACVLSGKPFVYGAVHEYEGQVSVFNYEGGPTYRCLFPNAPQQGEVPDCNTAGVLGVVPGIIGCRQALEVIRLITGIGNSLSGFLQVYDFLEDSQRKIKLSSNPASRLITCLQESYEVPACVAGGNVIDPDTLRDWYRQKRSFTLLDVREAAEFNSSHLPAAWNAPLSTMPAMQKAIDVSLPLVVYCQKGTRSLAAAGILKEQYPQLHLFQLTGGLDNWLKSEAAS